MYVVAKRCELSRMRLSKASAMQTFSAYNLTPKSAMSLTQLLFAFLYASDGMAANKSGRRV